MSELKVWVGHMSGDPTAWFIVSAPTRDEALWVADQLGEIETRSLHEVDSPFAVIVGSHVTTDADGKDVIALGSEDLHDENGIYWTDHAAEEWATDHWRDPLAGDDDGMIESASETAATQHPIDVTKTGPKIHRARRDEDMDDDV